MSSPFNIHFDINDYSDVLPAIPDDETEIINSDIDDIYEQFWEKKPFPNIITPEFIYRESKRLRDGVWMFVKGVLLWIPPNYYQFLQYGTAGGHDPQFRLKRLKNVYQKIRVRKDPYFIGSYTIKNRQDGETTMSMSDNLWEVHGGELDNGMIGIQSKTGEDAENPCWFNLRANWINYPVFFKHAFYPHFISGDRIAEKMDFEKKPDPNNPNDRGKKARLMWFNSVYNAMDGKGNVRKCVLDEINKWIECSFLATFDNYKKFILPGKQRKGLYDIFSSPADKDGPNNDEAFRFYQDCINLKNRILFIYSNPLEGIEGFYDKYGDVDPQEVFEHIMRERNSKRKDEQMAEIRGFPLPIIGTEEPNLDEIFGATDNSSVFINMKGIKERLTYVKSNKDRLGLVYGNIEWPASGPDTGEPFFRPADLNRFDDLFARWCFATTQFPKVPLRNLKKPPHISLIESCLGGDPFGSMNHTKNVKTQSLGAGVVFKFRDLSNSGWELAPTGIYLGRPNHKSLYHEDMIKTCIYTRSLMQYENSDGSALQDHFYVRGYDEWLLDSRDGELVETQQGWVKRKGDAPAGRGATKWLSEGISMIDAVTAVPLHTNDPDLLAQWVLEELLQDVADFNKIKTVFNHLTMALIQALLGRLKILFARKGVKNKVNNKIAQAYYG